MVRQPTLFQSLVPIAALVALIGLNVSLVGDDTLSGANQMSLIMASVVAALIAIRNGNSWNTLMDGAVRTITTAVSPMLILITIGLLAGTWMLSGVIPAMIYYGLDILRPGYFLPATVLITVVISLATGSSWSTVATVGVALLGIGHALGFSEPLVAGAIISGAYFGDKISPLSDTTNLAAATANVDIFEHIRNMMATTVPSIALTLVIFSVMSVLKPHGAASVESVQEVRSAICGTFHISAWLFAVPCAVIVMICRRWSPMPTLLFGGLAGAVLAVLAQGDLIGSMAAPGEGGAGFVYKTVLRSMYGSISVTTGNSMLDSLLSTSGMAGMLNTVWLILTAMVFAGIMDSAGFMARITSALMSRVSSTGGVVTTTVATCILFNATTADQYMSIAIPGKMFSGTFRRMRLSPEMLSRTLEDGATVTSVLIPWNTCGATQASVLGVSTWAYMPFTFFCIISPLMSILFAFMNWKVRRLPSDQE